MPNNCLSVLFKRIIQVENKSVCGGGGGGTNIPLPPPIKKVRGGAYAPLAHPSHSPPPPPPPPPASYASGKATHLAWMPSFGTLQMIYT